MAQTFNFTVDKIEAIQPPAAGRLEFKDGKVQGLYLRVSSSGVKAFSFLGRPKGSARVERVTIGKFPAVKIEEARRQAKTLIAAIASGESPATAARSARGEPTLSDLWTEYRANLVLRGKTTKTSDTFWRMYIEPRFAARRLSDVTAREVEEWHRTLPAAIRARRETEAKARADAATERRTRIAAAQAMRRRGPDPKPKQQRVRSVNGERSANGALGVLRAMFNWGAGRRPPIFRGDNPAEGHELFHEVERDRFLRPDELRPFFVALAQEPNQTMRDFILLALLTGARRANVAAMRWKDVDLRNAEWRIPAPESKGRKPQIVALGPEAVAILEARHRDEKATFVFPSDRSEAGHMQDPRRSWQRVLQAAAITDLRLHDLRRTLGSWQARTGASLVVIGKSLNHRSREATAIYARLDLDPVRQSVERATSAMLATAGFENAAVILPKASVVDKAKTAPRGST
jgi:integrase